MPLTDQARIMKALRVGHYSAAFRIMSRYGLIENASLLDFPIIHAQVMSWRNDPKNARGQKLYRDFVNAMFKKTLGTRGAPHALSPETRELLTTIQDKLTK